MKIAFQLFQHYISQRAVTKVLRKEDEMRYAFFLALLGSGRYVQTNIELEVGHPILPTIEIDTIVRAVGTAPEYAIEFKYDKLPAGAGYNLPMPQKAGKLFNDLLRLAHYPNRATRFLVYLTDRVMDAYMASNYTIFYSPTTQNPTFAINQAFWVDRPKVFHQQLQHPLINFQTRVIYESAGMINGLKLKIFEVC